MASMKVANTIIQRCLVIQIELMRPRGVVVAVVAGGWVAKSFCGWVLTARLSVLAIFHFQSNQRGLRKMTTADKSTKLMGLMIVGFSTRECTLVWSGADDKLSDECHPIYLTGPPFFLQFFFS